MLAALFVLALAACASADFATVQLSMPVDRVATCQSIFDVTLGSLAESDAAGQCTALKNAFFCMFNVLNGTWPTYTRHLPPHFGLRFVLLWLPSKIC
jgi:alpha-D-ribose 1-methylphosphonate 5-triphosphate synthase subunit PhnI